MKRVIYIAIFVLSLSSCFKDDKVVIDNSAVMVELESLHDFNGQIFFSLKDRKVVKQNGIYDWDMAFDCREEKFNIILNSAKGMAAYNTEVKNFDRRFEVSLYPWQYDHPCGDLDQTCIGEWGDFSFNSPQSFNEVYLINLGVRGQKTPLGFRKMQLIGFEDESYIFRFAELNGKDEYYDTIPKNPDYNFVYFSFQDSGSIVSIEPPKEDWDLLIGPYVDRMDTLGIYDIALDDKFAIYDGVSQNRYLHDVSMDTLKNIDELNYFDMEHFEWSSYTNLIGNSWRKWESKDTAYRMVRPRTYVVRSKEEEYYILNFLEYSKPEQFISRYRFEFKSL